MGNNPRIESWNLPFLMLQQNLRKIDAKGVSSSALAIQLIDEIEEYGGNAILANAGGIVAWYPTALSFQKPNEFLEGDFVSDILSEAHRRGIKVMLRLDVSKQFDEQYKEHPDWFIHDRTGQPVRAWEMLATCINGPYWRKHNFALIAEILDRYDPDGIFYNGFSYHDCFCDSCRSAFRVATSHELPEQEDWDDPIWLEYVRFRYKTFDDYSTRVADFIHARNAGVSLALPVFITHDDPERLCRNGWSVSGMRVPDVNLTEAFNPLDRAFPKWIYLGGEEARIGKTLGVHTAVAITYSEVFASRRSGQPAPQMTYDLMQIATHGGSPVLPVSGTFRQDDRKGLAAAKKTYEFLRDNHKYYEDRKSIAGTALYYSQKTMDFYGQGNSRERSLFEYRGFYEALVHNHIPFDVVHDGGLPAHPLNQWKTLILPNTACLDGDEIAIIDRFVHDGGNVIATYETSLYKPDGQPRRTFGLECLGFSIGGRRDMVGSYLLVGDKKLFRSFDDVDLLALNGPILSVSAKNPDAVVLTDLATTPPVMNNTPEFAYWEGEGEERGLLIVGHGKGRVAYLPWPMGKLYHLHGLPEYGLVTADLIDRLNGDRDIMTNAPASVEVTLTRGQQGLAIHLLNATGQQSKPQTEVIPLFDIELAVKTPHDCARSLVMGEDLDCRRDGDRLSMILPRLEIHDLISVY